MSKLEAKLQEVWGLKALVFCKACGMPTALNSCKHESVAPWNGLDERERIRVRQQAIRKAKADRAAHAVFTAAL